ncbi:MAG: adenylyl-sulfate kinase [Terrimicrobiaceae bacterium]
MRTATRHDQNPEGAYPGVTPAERALRNGQAGLVVWFTGLSGAGKTTLAVSVERCLFDSGYRTFLIDGDLLRAGLCCDLGFDSTGRHENIRRAGVVSGLMAGAGLICLTALISPFRADRLRVRGMLAAGCFLEVFVNAPLAVCESRDVKGLYQRARANEITDFTGISSAYEPPESPELEVRTDLLTVEASVALVFEAVKRRLSSLSKHDASTRRETLAGPPASRPILSK